MKKIIDKIAMLGVKNKKGFTLVEVTVATAIVVIVSVMIVYVFLAAANINKNANEVKEQDRNFDTDIHMGATAPMQEVSFTVTQGDAELEFGDTTFTLPMNVYTFSNAEEREMLVFRNPPSSD